MAATSARVDKRTRCREDRQRLKTRKEQRRELWKLSTPTVFAAGLRKLYSPIQWGKALQVKTQDGSLD